MQAIKKINAFLDSYNFSVGIKKIIRTNIGILAILAITALASLPVSNFAFWIFFGTFLAFWNFFFLAVFIQKIFNSRLLGQGFDKIFIFGQILISNLRLCLTGILMYSALVLWGANPFALVIGLTIPLASIPFLLLNKF